MKNLIEHITGKRLMERWNLDEHELLQITKKGLLAFEPSDAWETERIAAKYSGFLKPDGATFVFKPDYTDGTGNIFRCVFPEESKEIPSLIFKLADIKLWEALFISEPKTTPERTIEVQSTTGQSVDDFIRKLRIDYENNSEVKIQEPRKGPKNYNYVSLGFRSNEDKIWNDFINILQYSPHLYKLGPAHTFSDTFKKKMRNRDYDKKLRRLKIINEKLIEFFNNNSEVKIPENYKLYELCKEEGPGNYRFKFQHGAEIESYEVLYEEYTQEQLVAEIEELGKKYCDTEEQVFIERIVTASKIAIRKRFLSDEEIQKLVYPEKEEYLVDDYLTVNES